MREYALDLHHLLKRLRQDPRVTIVRGRRHRLVFVDDELVTLLPKGRRPSCDPNVIKASMRELRRHGVDLDR